MTDQLQELQNILAADGYSIDVTRTEASATVTITAGDGVCDDCLVPKNVMVKGFLETALGLNETQIQLIYPGDQIGSVVPSPTSPAVKEQS